ncbi:MAG: DNA recombination protein RmuC [Bacteroidota bacterium]|nr:DNA recombination protein RmuC [Bacteroidota bacterium]MDP4190960.1 DNA recombination protein RmuC [Bacteroidota bacterium]MDP4196127.1 DNA recombination protein RmuC [Bacteroidota bacterium]
MLSEMILISIAVLLVINILLTLRAQKNAGKGELAEIKLKLDSLDKELQRAEATSRDEFSRSREEQSRTGRSQREELNQIIKNFTETVTNRLTQIANFQKNQLDIFSNQLQALTRTNEEKLEKTKETVEAGLNQIREENSKKLEQMRATVDEKLEVTLEKRLGESFRLVSERLEQVQRGLGEMQSLASGVGDLKKVLSNVKTRGVLGEYQLGSILEQILSPEQYEMNVKTKRDSNNIVEYAVKLPGRDDIEKSVWLPIDSKFPTEDYQALLNAYEAGEVSLIEEKTKAMALRIKLCAKDIRDKYLDPPNTTDFAVLFLPFEGLYAEALRNVGLFETLQREYKIIITGPTTLAALLNSLQMGFKTLAIEKRSSEVWELLGAVKTEFGNFGDVLRKTQKKLQEASNVIEKAGVRSRAIEKKLRDVQKLPKENSLKLLEIEDEPEDDQNELEETPPSDIIREY